MHMECNQPARARIARHVAATLAALGLCSAAITHADEIEDGKQIFRYETFGDEQLWTDKLQLHKVVEQKVDPTTALKVGLKVDSEALPPGTLEKADLKDPKTTVALLKLNAVVGLKAEVDANNHITKLGVTCALCHSNVDDSVKPGIGKRMDGWANRDLNPGAIIALSPAITPEQKKVYASWGPGKYDPRYNQDGMNHPVVIPPAYGLANIKETTYTADGSISYWNSYVATTQMGGKGNFNDAALKVSVKHPTDMVTPKLAALRAYQHSLMAPKAKMDSFDATEAARGKAVFDKNCASCHVGGNGTDNNNGKLHQPADTGMDGTYAMRTKNKAYRTTPLRGLAQHPPYFHDGSAKGLDDVVDHYNKTLKLSLSSEQRSDLEEYLKTL
jgi:mono/diheme cytochrome c family protein